MSIKLIAIGNRLMGDDGVAIYVAETLRKSLEEIGIEVIIGETDFEYCLGRIYEGDYVIILDATWFGKDPGAITLIELKQISELAFKQNLFSQHGYSLIKALENYYKSIAGIIIGIEGSSFDFSLELTRNIKDKFDIICRNVNVKCQALKTG